MHKATTEPSRNTNIHLRLPSLIILISSLLLSAAAQAANSVGALKFARGDITIESVTGEKRKAVKGDDLMQNEKITTGAASLAVIQLKDDSRMILRPFTEFRVDKLVTDDDSDDSNGQPSAVLNLLRGGLRLITGLVGKANPAGYRLSTPVATIGIRGTEFNTRLCTAACAAEEKRLAGSEAAAKVKEGLYVKVDEGKIFLRNFSAGEPLNLQRGESGYVSDLNSLPVKLSLVPAFQLLDKIPSPSGLDFNNIEMPDDALPEFESDEEVAAVAVGAAAAAASEGETAEYDISGDYELDDIDYQDLPLADRKWFFGANPDLDFTLTQEGNKFKGEFSDDRDGTITGEIDGKEVTFNFVLEAKGGEYKEGAGTWVIQDDESLKGDFLIRDQQRGIVRGLWTLERD